MSARIDDHSFFTPGLGVGSGAITKAAASLATVTADCRGHGLQFGSADHGRFASVGPEAAHGAVLQQTRTSSQDWAPGGGRNVLWRRAARLKRFELLPPAFLELGGGGGPEWAPLRHADGR
jgi:hypothetical protein